MRILSIQSWVAYGHVGNAAATFPLQRLGAEVWPIHTVQFSNHTGYGDWRGDAFSGAQVAALVEGIAARDVLGTCDAVLSGYMGDPSVGEAVVSAVRRVKASNPAALYCCDPVIGDAARGSFVRPGVAELLRDAAMPVADIATPNHFELAQLTGLPCDSHARMMAAIAHLHRMGPATVLVTSARTEATPRGAVDMVVSDGDVCHVVRTPLLPIEANGAGDLVAALFLFHFLQGGDATGALEATASSVFGVLQATAEAKSAELHLIEAQEELVQPSRLFMANPC